MTTPENPGPGHQPGGDQPPPANEPPPGYQPAPGYQPPAYPPPSGGYEPARGYQPPPGYQPQPGGYPPPAGYQPQPGAYPPPAGYQPQPGGYPDQSGSFLPPSGAPAGYPPGAFLPPPAAPVNKTKKRLIIGGVLVVVLAIVGITLVVQSKTATTSASVGSCIKITSSTIINPDTSQEDCSSAAAIFVVTETGGGDISCDTNEVSFVQGKDTSDPSSRVCLRYNLKAGECLDPGDGVSSVPKKVSCSAATTHTVVKLDALITDSSDKSKCPNGSIGLPLVKRNLVYCLTAAS